MYEMFPTLMRAAATGHSAPSRRRAVTVTRPQRGRGRGLGIRSHAAGQGSAVAGSTAALRPVCAGVDAAAR